jgi:hypothetical protein
MSTSDWAVEASGDRGSPCSPGPGLRQDVEPGRWIVETQHDSRAWQVIVEPDTIDKLLIVITAFPVTS